MVASTQTGLGITAVTTIALGSGLVMAPAPHLVDLRISMASALNTQEVMLAGIIADLYNDFEPIVADVVGIASDLVGDIPIIGKPISQQINILYNYGEQAVADTVYWVDDLVTPLYELKFWPFSGNPGNYLLGAVDDTVNWVEKLLNTGVDFVQAEYNWLVNQIDNLIPDIINDIGKIIDDAIGIVRDIVKLIESLIPWSVAAAPPAAAAVTVGRGTAALSTASPVEAVPAAAGCVRE